MLYYVLTVSDLPEISKGTQFNEVGVSLRVKLSVGINKLPSLCFFGKSLQQVRPPRPAPLF